MHLSICSENEKQQEECISEDIWPLIDEVEPGQHEFSDHLEDKQIKQYLDRLPQAQREVVRGVYFQDMSPRATCRVFKHSRRYSKSRLRLACKLRNEMGELRLSITRATNYLQFSEGP